MADYDTYPAVLDDEEEAKKQPYAPIAAPMPQPDIGAPSFPAAAPPVGAAPSEPSFAKAAAATPAPKYSDYAPPEPHGLAKIGHLGAAFLGGGLNEYVNEDPQKRAKTAYEAATHAHDTEFNQGMKLSEEARQSKAEESQAGLRTAQAAALEPKTMVKVPWQDEPIAMSQKGAEEYYKTQQVGQTAENVAGKKAESAENVAGIKTKSAEDIASENRASRERIATAHNLASTEAARIRAAAANDPDKLTSTMKTMKQQAQATLPQIQKALDETEKVANLLGPGEGRWHDFWQGKVGANDPQYAHYRDEIHMVSTAVTLAHARGRMSNELYESFQHMFDAGKQSAENMIQALNVANEWLGEYAKMGEKTTPTPAATAAPKGPAPKTAEEYLKKLKK